MAFATLFDRFGGTRPMARQLKEAPSTVNSWKRRGRIPARKQARVLEVAKRLGLNVTPADVIFPLSKQPSATAPRQQ